MANRPKLKDLAYVLASYSNSTIPQTYINELSDYELLLSILNKINEIIERCNQYDEAINEVIGYLGTLDDQVIEYLDNLKESGYIAEQVKIATLNRKILIIGDSYTIGEGVTGQQVYTTLLANMGFDIHAYASSGSGFQAIGNDGKTFGQVMESYANAETEANRNAYTDVIYLGGVNDAFYVGGLANLSNAIHQTLNVTKAKFPNAKIHIGYFSQLHRPDCNLDAQQRCKEIYREQAYGEIKCAYVQNADYILKQIGLLQADGTHPNATGHIMIANYLASYLINGSIDIKRYAPTSFAKTDDSYLGDGYVVSITESQHNGLITVTQRTGMVLNFNDQALVCNPDTHAIPLGYLNNGLIWGQSDYEGAFSDINIPVMCEVRFKMNPSEADYTINALQGCLQFYQNKLLLRLVSVGSPTTYNTIYLKQINIVPFTFNINADLC